MKKLNEAIEAKDTEKVRQLLKEMKVLQAKDEYWESPLFEAARSGEKEITAILLEKGVDLNYQDYAGTHALGIAARNGHTAVVELLLDAGARIDAREGYEDRTALSEAVLHEHYAIVKLLLERGADADKHLKTKHGHDNGAYIKNREIREMIFRARGMTGKEYLLFEAVFSGDIKTVDTFLSEGVAPELAVSCFERTLLHVAADEGNVGIIARLIDHDIDLNPVDSRGVTPLVLALSSEHEEAALLLIHGGADVSIGSEIYGSPLACAAESQLAEVLALILSKAQSSESLSEEAYNALRAALVKGNEEITRSLIQAGANLDRTDDNEETMLFQAIKSDQPAVVSILIDAGIDINHQNEDGWTALHYSMAYPEAARTLYEAGADPWILNDRGETVLHSASMYGIVWLVEDLISKGADVNSPDKKGWSPLHHAAWHGRVEMSRLLLEHGADIQWRDQRGETALDVAVSQNKTELIKFLKKQAG